MLIVVITLFLSVPAETRLRIVESSGPQSLIRSGNSGSLHCHSNQPWFICIWRGPNGLAITKTVGQSECQGRDDKRFSIRGREGGRQCVLDITNIKPSDAGQYTCVLADGGTDMTTGSTNQVLKVGVASYVSWLEPMMTYVSGQQVDITCEASDGFPPPNLVVRTTEGVMLMERPDSGVRNTRMLTVDSSSLTNNTLITCHAEQSWDLTGQLIFNSTLETLRMVEVVGKSSVVGDCQEWYCGYEIFLFIMLVLGVLIIFSCCGMYFFFATRGKPYNMVMYNSEHGTWGRDSYVEKEKEVKETLIPGLRPGPRADIIRHDHNNSLYTEVNKTQKAAPPPPALLTPPSPPAVVTSSPIPSPAEVPEVVVSPPPASASAEQLNTTDYSFGDCLSLLSDIEANSTLDQSIPMTKDEMEEARKRYLLTLTEEEIKTSNTITTLEIFNKHRKSRSKADLQEEEDDEFVCETEMRKMLLRKYQLANVKPVPRLGRTYSKVVRDHLNNDPKLTISQSSVEFEVARPSSALSFCNRSTTSSPFPPVRDSKP